MSFVFATSHLPEDNRPLEEEEDDDVQPMLRASGVRAFSHLRQPAQGEPAAPRPTAPVYLPAWITEALHAEPKPGLDTGTGSHGEFESPAIARNDGVTGLHAVRNPLTLLNSHPFDRHGEMPPEHAAEQPQPLSGDQGRFSGYSRSDSQRTPSADTPPETTARGAADGQHGDSWGDRPPPTRPDFSTSATGRPFESPMPPGLRDPATLPTARARPGARTPAPSPPGGTPASVPPRGTPAPAAGGSSEVYVVGGVLRAPDKKNVHDTSAHHFYTSAARVAQKRAEALRKAGSPDKLTVIMYEPAYEVRATNDKKTDPSTGAVDAKYHRKLMETAASRDHYEVKFVRSKQEMLDEMAKATAKNPMKNGGYFGHSSKDQFLIDYGQNPPSPGSTQDVARQTISLDDLKKAGVRFHPDAHFASYGCSQGEAGGMMEQLSKDQKIKTSGSTGKTIYKAIGQGYSIPYSVNGYTSFQNGLPISPQIVSPTPPPPPPKP